MESFVSDNSVIEFSSISGEVLGTDKYSETHVSSSGGGGYVGRHGGHVSAPTVHSTVVTNHEFWIKTDGGKEIDVQLTGVDIPLRIGQRVSLIVAQSPIKKEKRYAVLVNHSANKHWFINDAMTIYKKLGPNPGVGGLHFLILIALFALWAVANSTILFLLGPAYFVYLTFKVISGGKMAMRKVKLLEAHLERLVQLTYQHDGGSEVALISVPA